MVYRLLVVSLALFLGLAPLTPPAAAQETATVVASGLDAPRGLAFGPDGSLFVAEAGRGGEDRIDWLPPSNFAMLGSSGRITRFVGDRRLTLTSGLQSLQVGPSQEGVGLSDLVFIGNQLYAVIGEMNGAAGGRPTYSRLVRANADGTVETVADLGVYEQANNPDRLGVGSNPYGLAAGPDGSLYVADAGANALLKVTTSGQISQVASWQNNPTPTGVAFDASGQPYVSFLSSFAYLPGSARVDQITPSGPRVAVPGLTGAVDLAFGPDGALYVLELSSQFNLQPAPARWQEGSGRILRVANGGREIVYDGLNFPSKMIFATNGALFVTNNAAFSPPGSGEVLMLSPERVVARGQTAPPPQSPLPGQAGPPPGPPAGPPAGPAIQPGPPSPPPAAAPPRPAQPVQVPAQLPRTGFGPGPEPQALLGALMLLIGVGLRRAGRYLD